MLSYTSRCNVSSNELLFLKKHKTTVHRRYRDFEALLDLLLSRYPYRVVPKLPPKKAVGGILMSFKYSSDTQYTYIISKIEFRLVYSLLSRDCKMKLQFGKTLMFSIDCKT